MTVVRQLPVVARACFRPTSTRTLIGVSAYCAFLAWLAFRGIESLGDTAYLYTGLPLAIAGTWIGACIRRTAAWTGSHFTPGLSKTLGLVAALAALAALGLHAAVASIGGLEPWPLVVWGPLALTAGMFGGGERPASTSYLILGLAILVPLTPLLQSYVSPSSIGLSNTTAAILALAAATVALSRFAVRLHRPTIPFAAHGHKVVLVKQDRVVSRQYRMGILSAASRPLVRYRSCWLFPGPAIVAARLARWPHDRRCRLDVRQSHCFGLIRVPPFRTDTQSRLALACRCRQVALRRRPPRDLAHRRRFDVRRGRVHRRHGRPRPELAPRRNDAAGLRRLPRVPGIRR